jgi:Zn finger protein HypA/HybF involved in hydrogenase expression
MNPNRTNNKSLTLIENNFLEKLVANGIDEITPTEKIDSLEFEGITEVKVDYSDEEVFQLLKTLTQKGVLKAQEYDRAIICPSCGSKYLHTKYNCPKCNSYLANKKELIEHPNCGFIGERARFDKNEKIVCPNCRATLLHLNGQDPKNKATYRIIGTSFECEKCGNNYERPHFTHLCIKCGTQFGYKKAQYKKLFTFKITDKINQLEPEKVEEEI